MIRALLAILVLAPAAQEGDLAGLLDRMEAKRKGLQDLRATVSTFLPLDLKTGVRDLRRWSTGPFVYRAPGNAAWTVRKDRADFFHGDALDQAQGVRASIHGEDFLLQAPWALHVPRDGPGRVQNHPYGASWFRGRLTEETPPLIPMLAYEPQEFPVALLYDLAPRKYLTQLPSLKLSATRKENGREFALLSAKPADPEDAARKEESARLWHLLTWIDAEIWVDVKEARIDRMTFRYENCSGAPRFRWVKEYRFSRYDKIGGIEAVPTSIGILGRAEHRPEVSGWRMDLTDIKVNGGATEDDVKLRPPPDRIVRDWQIQPVPVYEKKPDDAAAWLNLGAHRMRTFDYVGAEKAFRKVIELRPAAEEGYLGFATLVSAGKVKSEDAAELLERGAGAAKSDVLRWAAARLGGRDPAATRKLLESVRAARGDAPEILSALAELAANDSAEKRALCLQSMKAELAGGPISWLWNDWKQTQPSEKEKLAVIKLCEDALRKEDRSRVRLHLLDLHSELGKKEEVRKQARAIVALIEKRPAEAEMRAVDRIHEVFRAEKDVESIKRLEKAFAAREDDDGDLIRLVLEAERRVADGDVEAWVRYFDDKIMPPAKTKLETHWQPCARFIAALKREKKLTVFLERLFLTAEDDENFKFHRFAAQTIGIGALEGSDQAQFLLRLRELEKGPAASVLETLNLARTFVMEKKWKEARAKGEEVLATKDVAGSSRAEALRVIAMALEATGDFEGAASACTRALAEKDVASRHAFHFFKGRMLLSQNNPKGAVVSFALGFEDAAKEPSRARRWRAVDYIQKEILYHYRRPGAALRPLLEAAEASALAGPAGMQALLGVLRQTTGNAPGAVEAYAKARALWKDDPVLLRWHIQAAALAGQLDPAMTLRAEMIPLLAAEKKNLTDYALSSIGSLNNDISNGCIRAKNPDAARKFARILAAERISNDTNLVLASLLGFIQEEAFIVEIDLILYKEACIDPEEWASFHVHYPAAYAFHKMGQTGRAIAYYKDITAENGWGKSYVEVARAWIAQWEKEAKKP